MARNWKLEEAIDVVRKGRHKAAIQDIGRRFPLFAQAALRGEDGLVEIIKATTTGSTGATIRKVENALRKEITQEQIDALDTEDFSNFEARKSGGKIKTIPTQTEETEETEEVEKPKKAKKKKPKKKVKKKQTPKKKVEKAESDSLDLKAMTVAELRKFARDKGIPLGGDVTTKGQIIVAIENALSEAESGATEEPEVEDNWDEVEEAEETEAEETEEAEEAEDDDWDDWDDSEAEADEDDEDDWDDWDI